MLYVIVHTADIQDRGGVPDLLKAIRRHKRLRTLAPALGR
jgi:hypothetical protein